MTHFLEMGGYALYVWGSYGAAVLVFAWNVVAPRRRRREIVQRIRSEGP